MKNKLVGIIKQEGRKKPYTYKVTSENGTEHECFRARLLDGHYLLEKGYAPWISAIGIVCNENAEGADLRLYHLARGVAKAFDEVKDRTHYGRATKRAHGTGTGGRGN